MEYTVENIKRFVANNMPNYATLIKSNKDFKKLNEKAAANTFYLFSEKSKVPPMFKALSAIYKDKINFAFAQEGLSVKAQDELDVIEYPSLILVQDFD